VQQRGRLRSGGVIFCGTPAFVGGLGWSEEMHANFLLHRGLGESFRRVVFKANRLDRASELLA
jgi:hypothetical protein